jgi:integrase
MRPRQHGEGRVYERPGSGNLWIEYWVDGVQYRESSGSPDARVAAGLLKHRIAEKQASRHGLADFVGPQRTTVAELLDNLLEDYRIRGRKSLADTYYHVQAVRRHLADLLAAEVDARKLRWYVGLRLDEGVANATVNRELAALRRAFNLTKQDGQLRQVPSFPMLPEHNVRRGFFEVYEVELVVRCLPDYLQDLVRFAFLSGWRRGEIVGLQWSMIDQPGRLIVLPTSKNTKGRVLALEGEMWDNIERRYAERGLVPWVFHRYGQPIRGFRKAWAAACQATGMPGRHFHDLRRSAVRNLTRAGVPDKTAMDLTGHKTRSVYDRYNITSEEDLRAAARKLQGYLATVRDNPHNFPHSQNN